MKIQYSIMVAFLAGISGGFVGNSCSNGLADYLKERVTAQFQSEERRGQSSFHSELESIVVPVVQERNINLKISGEDEMIPEVPWRTTLPPSEWEAFLPTETNDDYLAGKVGFKYEINNVDRRDHHHPTGSKFAFEVRDYGEIQQLLRIVQFDGQNFFNSSLIEIVVVNGQMNGLKIDDHRHNTVIELSRSLEGHIEYKEAEITEEGARKLYDLYTGIFTKFKNDHHIDARIEAYKPTVNVRTSLP